jgi:SAM-dependent methyltransferase
MERISCINGCESSDVWVTDGKDLLFGKEGVWSVVRCASCGLMRTSPRPTKNEILSYYPDQYAPYQNDKSPTSKYTLVKTLLKRYFDLNVDYCLEQDPGSALEIGCAAGSYLNTLRSLGWEAEGIELSSSAALKAIRNGHKVFVGHISEFPGTAKSYDLIIGWMVVEHLHDPIADLKILHAMLKDSGRLIISVPNAGSHQFSIFKSCWFPLQLPTHLFHFDKKSISLVLFRSGFEVESIKDQYIIDDIFSSVGLFLKARGLGSLGGQIVSTVRGLTIARYLLMPVAFVFSKLNLTARIVVKCRKM